MLILGDACVGAIVFGSKSITMHVLYYLRKCIKVFT